MLKPLGNRVLVEKYVEDDQAETSASGLILAKKKHTNMAASKVVAIGVVDEQFKDIVPGCTVYYNKSTAFEPYVENDKIYYILEAKEILGIIEE